ncbi:hypothetical protein IX84_12940 [Phaeodactylibacter xiamenensis]|uniref:Transmembrane protein n=1 Tax=Phaeodactylibacter xiamenensis TaxID=1524460 RepID=A0A098S6T5_9BACT|nr:hypothetical protein IX84_12940 [Phaeodactylibacter xiamenensis]
MPTRSKFGAQNYFVVGIKIPVTGRKTKPLPASSSSGRFWGRRCLMVVMRKGHIRAQDRPYSCFFLSFLALLILSITAAHGVRRSLAEVEN